MWMGGNLNDGQGALDDQYDSQGALDDEDDAQDDDQVSVIDGMSNADASNGIVFFGDSHFAWPLNEKDSTRKAWGDRVYEQYESKAVSGSVPEDAVTQLQNYLKEPKDLQNAVISTGTNAPLGHRSIRSFQKLAKENTNTQFYFLDPFQNETGSKIISSVREHLISMDKPNVHVLKVVDTPNFDVQEATVEGHMPPRRKKSGGPSVLREEFFYDKLHLTRQRSQQLIDAIVNRVAETR